MNRIKRSYKNTMVGIDPILRWGAKMFLAFIIVWALLDLFAYCIPVKGVEEKIGFYFIQE